MKVRRGSRLPVEELEPYLLAAPQPPARLDWQQVFGNNHPVEMEIGFAKGLFLLNASEAHPDVNFVGVEIVRKLQLFTANRIAKRKRTNVRLACADARAFLRDAVVAGSLRAVHVYFPDPWWKKRHHKRRLFTPLFLDETARVLEPAGRLYFVTDVEEYYLNVHDMVGEHPWFQMIPPPDLSTPSHDLDYLTNFDRKFRKEGRPIYRLSAELTSRSKKIPQETPPSQPT